jgi:hypothetical protein
MEESAKEKLIKTYITAYNTFDIDQMLSVLDRDIVFKNISGGEVTASARGRKEFRDLAEQSRSIFAKREQRIISIKHDPSISIG